MKRTFYDFSQKFYFWRWLAQFFCKDYDYYFDRRNDSWCREIRNVQCRIENSIETKAGLMGDKPIKIKVRLYTPISSRWIHYAQIEWL